MIAALITGVMMLALVVFPLGRGNRTRQPMR